MGPPSGGARVPLPSWLSEADLDIYAGGFARSGFRGPLDYYRNVDRNWELMAAFERIKGAVPALYVAGDHDLVIAFRSDTLSRRKITTVKVEVNRCRLQELTPGAAG